MRDFDDDTYGERFADVYDDWYQNVSDVEATVNRLRTLGGDGPYLELGVGTGRIAVPLAAAGATVTGVDSSTAMLERLAAKEGGDRVTAVRGDMVGDLPAGPFGVVFVAYNTLFSVTDPVRQRRLFVEVADRLSPDGCFVVEAFVPDPQRPAGSTVAVRTLEADRVVLMADRHDPIEQRVDGQFIDLEHGRTVRLRPFSIRYASPEQIDAMATEAGLVLSDRWEDMSGAPFTEDSPAHVSVYRRVRSRILTSP